MLFKALISIQYISSCQKDLKELLLMDFFQFGYISKTGVPTIIERR